jgi:hypothetical protein
MSRAKQPGLVFWGGKCALAANRFVSVIADHNNEAPIARGGTLWLSGLVAHCSQLQTTAERPERVERIINLLSLLGAAAIHLK